MELVYYCCGICKIAHLISLKEECDFIITKVVHYKNLLSEYPNVKSKHS